MANLYDDPQRTARAKYALHTLHQGQQPVEDYVVDFCKWSEDSGWNDAALKYQLRLGLSETLKDELAMVEAPTSLENLIQLSIQLHRAHPYLLAHVGTTKGSLPAVPASVPQPTSTSEGEPMQIGLLVLISEEIDRQ